jgi:hypothetical protein
MKSKLYHCFLITVILVPCFLIGHAVFPQTNPADNHDHHDGHSEIPNEIGGAVGPVYDLTEDAFGLGLHLHYTRMLDGKLHKLGVGGGFEAVFLDHTHYNISAMAVFRPVHPLWVAVGPGLAYFTEENQYKLSLHVETGYEFELKSIHIGPMIEYAFAGGDHHFMVGLHVGFPF